MNTMWVPPMALKFAAIVEPGPPENDSKPTQVMPWPMLALLNKLT